MEGCGRRQRREEEEVSFNEVSCNFQLHLEHILFPFLRSDMAFL